MKKALLFALLCASCGSDFDPSSRIVGTRVLAVKADKPWAAPGETVNLEALAIDTLNRPLSWGWTTCVDPESTTVTACLQKIASDVQSGSIPPFAIDSKPTHTFTVPSDTLSRLPAEARGAAYVGVLIITCPGTIDLRGRTDDLPLACVDASGRALRLEEFEVGIKRIFVREKDRNTNPVLASITWDGAPWDEKDVKEVSPCGSRDENRYDRCDGEKHTVAGHVTNESYETGKDEQGDTFTEQLVVSYYATEGIFEYDVRVADKPDTGWVARAGASGTTVTLWFVARDNRGGVSWLSRQVKVR